MGDGQQSAPTEDIVAAWKARIDALATQLMIEGASSGIVEGIHAFAREAHAHGALEAADIAGKLAALLVSDLERGTQYLLETGLAELQAALPRGEAVPNPVANPASLSEDAELVADFLVEAREHLSQIEGQMLLLERDPSSMEVIHAVFRAFHTIKGLAGFFDFRIVQAVAHEVETLLDLARNEKLTVTAPIVDVVLESGDFLQNEVAAIEHALHSGAPLQGGDNRQLLTKIRSQAAAPVQEDAAPDTPVEASPSVPVETAAAPSLAAPEIQVAVAQIPELPKPSAETQIVPLPEPTQPAADVPAAAPSPLPGKNEASPTQRAGKLAVATPAAQTKEQPRSADAGSVRVETAKLDHLMDMVGEIVIAQSLIRHNQLLAAATDSRLLADLAKLARVTVEVQRATMSMRMIPVGQLFQRIERVIRDLSRKAGKQIVLETSGTETGIDKTVAEELSDPLLHMVRNSVDHGIESVAERIAAGKSPDARIRLSAHHQGGQVIIQISDDGRGLNSEKIRRKAEERQLISSSTQLTEAEIYQLIFEPGFSTAEKITDVSGRGVGMDVVRRNVEKLRGRIETQSTLGQGTTFMLKLPLTLAIIDGLVVEVGAERFIIPLSGVREIFRPQSDALFTVEGRDEMLLVRGQLLPVVRLHQRLDISGRSQDPSDGLMVVVEAENRCFCLLVDDLLGKQEVVIKSLGETFKDVSGLSGCAVLGDGHIGLILDMDGIYRGRR